jgi:hypothetical protein
VNGVSTEPLAPRALPAEAIDALLRAAGTEPNVILCARDEALLAMLISAGLRVQEVCDIQLRVIDMGSGTVTIRSGKAGKARRSPLHANAQRLSEKASGLGLCQASKHETDHSDENPGFFTTGKHFIIFGEPSPGRKPSESAFHNPAPFEDMKTAGTDLLPIDDGILWSPDPS